MSAGQSTSLALRAALYLGMQREPRTSVTIPKEGKAVIVAERDGSARCALAVYEESPNGERQAVYIWLTERQRELLSDALTREKL